MQGTETTCYTSIILDFPVIKLRFKADFKIDATVILLQIS